MKRYDVILTPQQKGEKIIFEDRDKDGVLTVLWLRSDKDIFNPLTWNGGETESFEIDSDYYCKIKYSK